MIQRKHKVHGRLERAKQIFCSNSANFSEAVTFLCYFLCVADKESRREVVNRCQVANDEWQVANQRIDY